MIEMINFSERLEEKKVYSIPTDVYRISFSYEGGRTTVYINGEEVFNSNCAGSDFSISIDKK